MSSILRKCHPEKALKVCRTISLDTKPVISFVIRAPDVANSYTCVAAYTPAMAFIQAFFDWCIQSGGDVVVEEVQLGDPVYAIAGGMPPRAALVISSIGQTGVNVMQEILTKMKAASATGEPQSKMARQERPTVQPFELIEALNDQGMTDFSIEDFEGTHTQQLLADIRDHLGPQQWYERVQQEWGDKMLFRVLPFRPFQPFVPEKMPLAWRDGVEDAEDIQRVIGLCPRGVKGLSHVLRPALSSFEILTTPSHKELQELADWLPISLKPMVKMLVDGGTPVDRAVQMVQDEYHKGLQEAPHAGVGVNKAHCGIFTTIKSTSDHVAGCQRCLKMLGEMRQTFVAAFGLFSVFSFLFAKLGANTARGTCALLMMLSCQLFVGCMGATSVAASLLLVGATSIGKTFILDMIRKMIPSFLQDSASSKSDQGDLTGDPLGNIPNVFVNTNGVAHIMNELIIRSTTSNILNRLGDGYNERTSGQAPKDGVRPAPIMTFIVWVCQIIIAATNSICGTSQPDPAVEQRFMRFTGMKIPSNFASVWSDKHAEADCKCARQLSNLLICAIDLQNGALNHFTDALPAFPWATAAIQALMNEKNITPRAVVAVKGAIPAAYIADRTVRLLLDDTNVSMTDLLIARCLPIPLEFALALLQPVAGTGHDSNHQGAFANMSLLADLPSEFRTKQLPTVERIKRVPPGYVIFPDHHKADVKKRTEMLLGAARGTTVDPKMAAETIATHLTQWSKIEDIGISTELLTIQPHDKMIDTATRVLKIFGRLLKEGLLLVDETGENAYLPHGLLRWLNRQDGRDADIFDSLADSRQKPATTLISEYRNLVIDAAPADPKEFNDKMAVLTSCFKELEQLRTRGLPFALFHCGLEYPYVLNTAPYPVDKVLEECVAPPVDQAQRSRVHETPPGPLDFHYGPNALKSLDIYPSDVPPPRLPLLYIDQSAADVPQSLRKLSRSMRLPYAITVPLANNGSYILMPHSKPLSYGDTLTDNLNTPNFELCAHPNDQLGDAITTFVDGKYISNIYDYICLLYTMLYCIEDLLLVPGVTDASICRVGQFNPAMSPDWDIKPEKELTAMKERPTSTVRLVLIALLVHAVGASNRIRYPIKFVRRLIANQELAVGIVKFIVTKISTEHLVKCCRKTAEKLLAHGEQPENEYLRSMIAECDEDVYAAIEPRITAWYGRLRTQLHTVYPAATFDRFREAATPRNIDKDTEMVTV